MSARPWDIDPINALSGADDVLSFVALIALAVVGSLLLPIVFLLLITGVEWLALLVLVPLATLGRLIFGKHWTIEVRHEGHLWEIDGGTWRESQAAMEQIAAQIEAGTAPELGAAVA